MKSGLRNIYEDNLGFQTVADSLANRYLDNVLSEHITSPEWENVIKWQANFELLHSESYSLTIREVYANPEEFFEKVLSKPEIQNRLTLENSIYEELSRVFDEGDDHQEGEGGEDIKKKAILRSVFAQYALENIRFMVSFLYTFQINELTNAGIQGTANSIALIAKDELIHTVIFRNLINILRNNPEEGFSHLFERGKDGSESFAEKNIISIFDTVLESEMEWFKHLSKYEDIPGMTDQQVFDFLAHHANQALSFIGYDGKTYRRLEEPTHLIEFFEKKRNVSLKKVLAQENDVTSYTIGVLEDFDKNNKMDMKEYVQNLIEEVL
jgi:ribonucleotide reductase beta subunit family protein with ferritin-like domain